MIKKRCRLAKLIEESVLEAVDKLLDRLSDLLADDFHAASDAEDEGWRGDVRDEMLAVKKLQKLLRETPTV
jgi:hypothetical protein